MKWLLKCVVLLMLIIPIAGCNNSRFTDIGSTSDESCLLDTESVHWIQKGQFAEYWAKFEYSGDARKVEINAIKKYYINIPNPDDFDYKMIRYVVDVPGHRDKIVEILTYDKKGNVMNDAHLDNEPWDSIVPETFGETTYNKVTQLLK
jgi:hypothetical protein